MTVNPVRLMQPRRIADDRGWFSETFREKDFAGSGVRFVQDNHSLSRAKGTLRGIHFQLPPHAQHKLVRCVRGAIFDVVVDIRRASPTYGAWAGTEISAQNGKQLFIPIGFGHGFLTLEADTEITYKVSDGYAPECDSGLRWNDPEIGIEWPSCGPSPHLSPKDASLPFLREFVSPFEYDGQPLVSIEP
jgi:dTDP-4-dehydrorhamnose 3,5-epimerase